MARITNAVLAEKINNLSKYLHERNDNQDKRLDKYSTKIEKNTVAIAGQKAVNGVIAFVVSIGTTLLATYYGSKHL